MLFPSSVLCNDAGQAVLRQKVRTAINQLNRDWNFCSYAADGNYHSLYITRTYSIIIWVFKTVHNLSSGTRECKELDINVKCEHRANARQTREVPSPPTPTSEDTYVLDAIIPVEE